VLFADGEAVIMVTRMLASFVAQPIIGFFVRDRLGQDPFGDNTLATSAENTNDKPVKVAEGEMIEARFEFEMRILPVGDYSVSVAIAEGNRNDHIQHQWIRYSLFKLITIR
jgi:lipopolysaccharide transport system ATP-binding protein